MANRVLTPVTELDFDGIKQNLKNYLSTTTEFRDFDYEGSGINILLDVLAYNTHYTAMYANMLAAESFLDSAVLRKSIVSLAKNLGYVPSSRNAATATVTINFGETAGVPNSIPTGTQFLATKDGIEYVFTTIEAYNIDKTSVPYKAENVDIYQGQYKSSSFIYDPDSSSTKFEIPSDSIDKDLVRVYVMRSASDLTNADINWRESTDFLELTPTSKVYFINENYRGKYEVSFGDNILGLSPEKGNYILIIYLETEGSNGNDIGKNDPSGINTFSFGGIGGNNYNSTVSVVSASAGGAERETQDRIKYAAPRYYQSQDRAVTARDYEAIILREFADAESVRIWGGEENDPPQYGKVFVSILPKNAEYLSDSQKRTLVEQILSKKKVISINPEIVDPDYTYILLECNASYSSDTAFITETSVKDSINIAIARYASTSLGLFGNAFRYSTMCRLIDLSSNTMVSNRISTRLLKKIVPSFGKTNYTLDFGTPLFHPYDGNSSIVSTSLFFHRDGDNNSRRCFIEDNGRGRLVMYTTIDNEKVVVQDNVGSIDYQAGKINLTRFAPTGTILTPYVKFIVTPDQKFDIVPKRNQILDVDFSMPESVVINLQNAASRKI